MNTVSTVVGEEARAPARPTILVVEDNPITRKMVRVALQTGGYTPVEASDGLAALEQFQATRPDAVLLDLGLPGMDGFEVARRLRARPGGASVPILALTGYLSKEEEIRACGNFDELLLKPLEPSRLLEAVRAYVALSSASGHDSNAGRGRRALVVDDDPVQLKLARIALTLRGFEVTAVASAAEALARAAAAPPEIIVSDILMPGMDGFRLAHAIRQEPRLAGVPVVLATSQFVAEEDRVLARQMGARACVVRTAGLDHVVEAMLDALDGPRAVSIRPPLGPFEEKPYLERITRQLERQAAMNSTLLQRASLQSMTLAVLTAIAEGLTRGEPGDVALADVLAQCLDATAVSMGAIFLAEGGGGALRLRASVGDPAGPALQELWGHGQLLEHVIASGALLAIPSPEVPEALGRSFLADAGLKSAVLLPIVGGGEPLGLMLMGSRLQDLPGGEWRAFVRTFALQLGQALALSRAFARLAISEARARVLMDSAKVAIVGRDGVVRDVSRRAEALFGRPREELVGRMFTQSVAPEGVADAVASFQECVEKGSVEARGVVIALPNGGRRRVDISGAVVSLGDEKAVFAIARDMTEQYEAERRLRERARLADLVAEVNIALNAAAPLTDCLGRCTEALVRHLELAHARVWLLEPATRTLAVEAASGIAMPSHYTRLAIGERVAGRVALERRALLSNVAGADASIDRELFEREKIVAYAAHPLIVDDEVVGVIGVLSREALSAPTIDALASISDAVANGIRRKKVEQERATLQAQLIQAQRMEAIGQLSGGIAHDFNNVLAVILTCSEFVLDDMAENDPRRADLVDMKQAGERAASLTRQLLAFSRQAVVVPRVLDLNDAVGHMEKMLRRIIGEDIALGMELDPGLARVKADPTQIEQVVMNLVVNARDAMPQGGTVTLTTSNELGPEGPVVRLSVVDTGCGMDEATRARVFEPFFTTKEKGRGTGLGLATVFGIVTQSRGSIRVESAPGRGTSVHVELPATDEERTSTAAPARERGRHRGGETVLVVEDESVVRAVVVRVLRGAGYAVTEASSAEQARALVDAGDGAINLLLTDVVMPGTSGPDLAAAVCDASPGTRVLLMSGYTEHPALRKRIGAGQVSFLQKPFTPESLAAKVREVLDA